MGADYFSSSTRDLGKSQLGGVIFGTKRMTYNECLSKQLFGLPGPHFAYVRKIEPGLPLFLFNYTDRTLLGIFEAASSGQMNIDPYAWTCDGSNKTSYPAQVQVRVKLQCKVLTENEFKPIIIDNYYTPNHFWFELDHAQTNRLLSLLSSNAFSGPRKTLTSQCTTKQTNFFPMEKERVSYMPLEVGGRHLSGVIRTQDLNTYKTVNEKDAIFKKIEELALKHKTMGPSPPSTDSKIDHVLEKKGNSPANPVITQLIKKVEDLMGFKAVQNDKINHLEQKIASMEQTLAERKAEIKSLKGICNMLESQTFVGPRDFDDINEPELISDNLSDDSILLLGGYDGVSWLSSLDCYSPSQNLSKPLNPMTTERCYAAVSKLDGEIFVFGGGTRGQWFDTVDSYDPVTSRWTTGPPLNRKNGSLAGATVNDKIYAIGGGNGIECYSSVEMLDFDVGAWIPTRSMIQKRFALAAAELNGSLYAVGGYDGQYYLRTAERFDPREHSWRKIENMSTARGCPSMVVLNEKLFVLGGYDGNGMVSTVEIYDPRRGSWMSGEPMNYIRGFSAAAVVKDCIYIFGGLKNGQEINDIVECYKEGGGWEVVNTNGACRKCFLSAITL